MSSREGHPRSFGFLHRGERDVRLSERQDTPTGPHLTFTMMEAYESPDGAVLLMCNSKRPYIRRTPVDEATPEERQRARLRAHIDGVPARDADGYLYEVVE